MGQRGNHSLPKNHRASLFASGQDGQRGTAVPYRRNGSVLRDVIHILANKHVDRTVSNKLMNFCGAYLRRKLFIVSLDQVNDTWINLLS